MCNGCKHSFIFKVILVQVNPGEAFTIRREDGQFQCITGKDDKFILIFFWVWIRINKREFVVKVKEWQNLS